jgi:hypothetical protein
MTKKTNAFTATYMRPSLVCGWKLSTVCAAQPRSGARRGRQRSRSARTDTPMAE